MAKRTKADAEGATAQTVAALDRLFLVPPREFIALRAELVAGLKSEGDAAGAKAVAAARRPPPSAWALNVVARQHAETMAAYVDAAARLPAAQREMIRGEDTGPFAAARREIAEHEARVLARAKEAMASAGLGWTPDVRRRIAQTLHAIALAGDDDRGRLLAGRLQEDLDAPNDFEALAASLGTEASGHRRGASRPVVAPPATDEGRDSREERAAEARRAREREAQAEEQRKARAALARAKENAAELEITALDREKQASALRREAVKAERAAAAALSAAERAEKQAAESREEATAAQATVEQLSKKGSL